MLTSSSTNSKEYFEGSFSPKSTTSQASSLLSTLQLDSGPFTKLPEISHDNNNNNDSKLQFLGTFRAGVMTNPLGMTLKPPPETGNTNNNSSSGSGSADTPKRGSRLDQIQAQFRQKLESEKELKLRDIFEKSRQDADRRIERITGGATATNKSALAKPSPLALDDPNVVSSGSMMKEFFQERRNLEMNSNLTGLPSIQTHLKNKRREYHQQYQQQKPADESALKPPRHLPKKNSLSHAKAKPLSPIAPPPKKEEERMSDRIADDSFNSTYSLSSSTLHPGNFPPSPDSPPTHVVDPAPTKTLLPPVKAPKKRRDQSKTPRKNEAGAASSNVSPPRMAPLRKPAPLKKQQQKAAAKAAMEAENIKFLDKILEAERRKSAQRRRNRGEDSAAGLKNGGSGDQKATPDVANCSIKRREDEIMKQINQKMLELERLRSQNKDLGDRSRGSSRGGTPLAVERGRGAAHHDDHVDGAALSPQTREDAAFAGRQDAVQAPGSSRRRARGPPDQRCDHNSDNGNHDDVEEQRLSSRTPTQLSRSSSMARRPPPSIPASPPLPASSSAAAPADLELDAFHSRPRVGLDENEDSPTMRQLQYEDPLPEEPLRKSHDVRRDASPPATRRKIAPRPGQMDGEVAEPVGGSNAADTNFGADESDAATSNLRLVSCGNCGRRFAEDRVAKHEKACSSQKARRQYDTKKHRVLGQDHAAYALDAKYQKEEPKKESNWRAKREEFIRNVRYARGAAKGGDAGAPPPPTVNPDYVQCPHCERRFNEAAAERHIPKCKDLKTKSVGQKSAVGNSARTLAKPPSNTRRR